MERITVEVDLYSGQQNPSWVLSRDSIVHFFDLFDTLPSVALSSADLPYESPLGYRGLKALVETDVRSQLLVSRGIVQVSNETGRAYRQDPQRGLEKWLLQTGKDSVGPELLSFLLRQIESESSGRSQ